MSLDNPYDTTLIDSLPIDPWGWRKPVEAKPKLPKTTPEEHSEQIRTKNHKYTVSPKGRARRREVYAQRNALKAKAERVNKQDFSISPTPRADLDRNNMIRGGAGMFRTFA